MLENPKMSFFVLGGKKATYGKIGRFTTKCCFISSIVSRYVLSLSVMFF